MRRSEITRAVRIMANYFYANEKGGTPTKTVELIRVGPLKKQSEPVMTQVLSVAMDSSARL